MKPLVFLPTQTELDWEQLPRSYPTPNGPMSVGPENFAIHAAHGYRKTMLPDAVPEDMEILSSRWETADGSME